jgi:DNA-binding CsgD family transcriptional regulator
MVYRFHSLIQSIATAATEEALRFTLMDRLDECFGVQRWGIYLMGADNELASVDAQGVSDNFIDRYQQFGKTIDPVLDYVNQYHAPAHEELVLPCGGWKQSELYQRCCSEYNHEHIMTGPVVGKGQLIGTVNFARIGDNIPAFNSIDLANLGAICSHVSVRLAQLQTSDDRFAAPLMEWLTPRELQIANLVAKGLTNKEIGLELWITHNSVKQALKRMFRKLEVSARTELVAKLGDLRSTR